MLQVHVKLRRRLQKYGLLREELNLATASTAITDWHQIGFNRGLRSSQ